MEPGFDEKGYLLAVAEGLEAGAALSSGPNRFGCAFLFLKAEEGLFSFGPYLDAPNTRAAAEALWPETGGVRKRTARGSIPFLSTGAPCRWWRMKGR